MFRAACALLVMMGCKKAAPIREERLTSSYG